MRKQFEHLFIIKEFVRPLIILSKRKLSKQAVTRRSAKSEKKHVRLEHLLLEKVLTAYLSLLLNMNRTNTSAQYIFDMRYFTTLK